jgi:putative acetyltransferase
MAGQLTIRPGGLDDPRVVALLQHHHATCHAVTPPGSAHAFDVMRLKAPDVWFWTGWENDAPVAVGALKWLSPEHGEVKSMHTLQAARRRGYGAIMLGHIIAEARKLGFARLSLETGSFDFFRPAVALYKRHGFVECAPFEGYKPDRNSTFLTRDITAPS